MSIFNGYMQVQLKTLGTHKPRTFYTEDWADDKKRKKILGKPRTFSVTIHLFNTAGQSAVETIPLPCKGDLLTLSRLIKDQVTRMMKENPYQEFDLVNSVANVRV